MRYRILPAVAVISAVLLLTSCNGAAGNVFVPEVGVRENLTTPLYANGYVAETQGGSIAPDPEDEAILAEQMECVLSNAEAELYFGPWKDVALRSRKTGAIVFSNREAYDPATEQASSDLQSTAYSQLALTYYNLQNEGGTMTSYPDAFDNKGKDQVSTATEDGVFKVSYTLGTKIDSTGLLLAMTDETYEQLYARAQEMAANKEISQIDASKFKGWYPKVTLETLPESEQAEVLANYPVIGELGSMHILSSSISNSERRRLMELLVTLGVDQAFIDAEMEKLGTINREQTSPLYIVTLCYQLDGADLLVWVDTAEIQPCESYFLSQLEILGSFGASRTGDEGYLFIPDGSGAIIRNDTTSREIDEVTTPFYGMDFGTDIKTKSAIQSAASFPVYGIKRGEQAVFGLVESGESLGGVTATVANKDSAYNRVRLWMNYMVKDSTSYSGQSAAEILLFSKTVPNVQFRVRYHVLTGERADYAGMADYYRTYLEQVGLLEKSPALTGTYSPEIEWIGGLTLQDHVMGITVTHTKAATTFTQARELSEALQEACGALHVRYSGALKGGLDAPVLEKVNLEPALGSTAEWEAFQQSLSDAGGDLSLGLELMRVYTKSGLSPANDLARFMSKSYAEYTAYDPSTGERSENRLAYLLRPSTIADRMPAILSGLTITRGVYLPGFGSLLYGDYTTDGEIHREETKAILIEQMKALREAGYTLTVDGTNLYAVPYADRFTNVAVESSHSRLEAHDVPFVGMVLHGYKPLNSLPLNEQPNYQTALLKAVESGAAVSYRLMAADNALLFDTAYTEFMSMSADIWMDEVIGQLHKLGDRLDGLADQRIIDHEVLEENLVRVTYENGCRVLLNYTSSPAEIDGVTVESLDFAVVD